MCMCAHVIIYMCEYVIDCVHMCVCVCVCVCVHTYNCAVWEMKRDKEMTKMWGGGREEHT